MPRFDRHAQRLFLRASLAAGMQIELDRGQVNYLVNVLRMGEGDGIIVFNGRDGEWRARLTSEGRDTHRLFIHEATRLQPPAPDLHYLFSPLKHAPLDYKGRKQ